MALALNRTSPVKARILSTLVLALALIAQPMYGLVANHVASAAPNTMYATTNYDSLSWAVDRKAPASHSMTSNSFSMTVDPATAGATDYLKQEGFNADINSNTTSIKADLFIDPAWEGKTVSTSLWGQTSSPNAWPRVEFTNKDGFPHITSMRSLGGEPVFNGSVPVEYGSTVTVEVAVDTISKHFVFYVNDVEFYRYGKSMYPPSWAASYDPYFVPFNKVFVQAWNTGVAGDTYTATWSNLRLGVFVPAVPAGLASTAQNGTNITNGATNVNFVRNSWTAVDGADSYNYEFRKPNSLPTFSRNQTTTFVQGQFHNSNSPEGQYAFRVQAVFAGNITSQWSEWSNVSYDKTAPLAPTFTVDGLSSGQLTNQYNITARWAGSSDDVVRYEYNYWNEIDGNQYKEASPYVVFTANQAQGGAFNQGDGMHYMRVRAFDAAGNVSPWSNVFEVNYDGTLPTVNITSATVTGGSISFEGSVSDANLNYYYCWLTTNQIVTVDGHAYTPGQEVRLNGDTDSARNAACNTMWAGGETSFSGTLGGFTTANFPAGSYTINLVAYDKAGNSNVTTPATYNVTIEEAATEPPVDTGSNPGGNTSSNQGTGGESPVTTDSTPDNNPTQLGIVAQLPFASIISGTGDNAQDSTSNANNGDVLGEQDSETGTRLEDTAEVLGIMDQKFFGLLWYWWVVIIAALVAGWLFLAAAIRRRREEEE